MSDTSTRDPRGTPDGGGAVVERIEPDENADTAARAVPASWRCLILKGLYHWAQVTGFVGGEEEVRKPDHGWQTAIYFAVIELVAAVGSVSPRRARWRGLPPSFRWR
jgi:hypothetical protein